jgi:hypothetical protein
MTNELSLMEKLAVSKKIMDAHNKIPTGGASPSMDSYNSPSMSSYNSPSVDNYAPVKGTYNIPQEFLQESQSNEPYLSSLPKMTTAPQPMTTDRVMSSKLPDAIKRLMIEHPIEIPNSMGGGGSVLSDELVEKATRLMNTDARGNQTSQPKQRVQEQSQPQSPNFNMKELKSMLREVVEEVLQENGILSESEQKSNEVFSFKVGKHIFEGKVTKIKKIS